MKRIICIWPDATWCEQSEVAEYSHMSDDYEIYSVPEGFTDEECEELAQERAA